MKITEALLAEHQVFHNLFDHLERTAPRCKTLAELKALAAVMEAMLVAHSHTEDELFLGPLDPCFEQLGHCDTFHEEHQEIDRTLRNAQQTRRLAQARQLLLAAVAACRKHFDKEERIVFPLAERLLKSKTLTALTLTWLEQRKNPKH
jgi:hemerythrin-like domain-containing protein